MKHLDLGLPNGSLEKPTFGLMSKAGMEVVENPRSFRAEIHGIDLFGSVILMRPMDIPEALAKGIIDCGICGLDWVVEYQLGLEKFGVQAPPIIKLAEFNYSRQSRQPVKVVMFGREDSPPIGPMEDARSISSEYPNITEQKYPHEKVMFSHGTTEAKVVSGLFDYGVCVTETGSTIEANGLKIVDTLLVSPTVLIARERLPELELFAGLIAGALMALDNQSLTINVEADAKEQMIAILPALKSPTISPLADGSFAIHTVAPKKGLADLLMKLQSQGATGILVQDINVILP